jgi:hypothetical protein
MSIYTYIKQFIGADGECWQDTPDRIAVRINGAARTVTDAEILAGAKLLKIAEINTECRARILARWPLEKQISANLGVYGSTELEACQAWVASHIDASNTASDAVDAAQSVANVEAVTVAWPV